MVVLAALGAGRKREVVEPEGPAPVARRVFLTMPPGPRPPGCRRPRTCRPSAFERAMSSAYSRIAARSRSPRRAGAPAASASPAGPPTTARTRGTPAAPGGRESVDGVLEHETDSSIRSTFRSELPSPAAPSRGARRPGRPRSRARSAGSPRPRSPPGRRRRPAPAPRPLTCERCRTRSPGSAR